MQPDLTLMQVLSNLCSKTSSQVVSEYQSFKVKAVL